MKKALKITGLILGISCAMNALFGLVAVIMSIVQAPEALALLIFPLVVTVLQAGMGALLLFGSIKANKILTLVGAGAMLVLLILDLFVLGGAYTLAGRFFAGLMKAEIFLTLYPIFGYITLAGIAAVIGLQVFVMLQQPAVSKTEATVEDNSTEIDVNE